MLAVRFRSVLRQKFIRSKVNITRGSVQFWMAN
jgi:hypothetical protein